LIPGEFIVSIKVIPIHRIISIRASDDLNPQQIMREVAEITSETPKSRVPQKYKKTKKGRGLENCFPETLPQSVFTAFQTADATYQLLSD
jgi:hypothetical protein